MDRLVEFKNQIGLVDGQKITLEKLSKGGESLFVVAKKYSVPGVNFEDQIRDGRNESILVPVTEVLLTDLLAEQNGLVAVGKRDWYLWAGPENVVTATASGNMHTQFKNPKLDWERAALAKWANSQYQEFSLMVDDKFGGQGLADLLTVLSLTALKEAAGIRRISTASDLGHTAADRIWIKLGWEGDRTQPTSIDPIADHPYAQSLLSKWVLNQEGNI
jgi:hypothetical protein